MRISDWSSDVCSSDLGGADLSLRSVEKFVAYWNPALKADAKGHAQFTFTTPDNLSGWRVLAMAVTPSDRMGLGQGGIKVSKPTELRSALPNQRSEEHTSELQSLMRMSYAVFCLKTKKTNRDTTSRNV